MNNLEQYPDAQGQDPMADSPYGSAPAPDAPLQQPEPSLEDGDQAPVQDDFAQQAPELDTLAHLPLDLTLRCGRLTLTLGELRQLCSGTVLEVGGVTPGFATLCHGERVVAEGELVDVDGRLGLQITRTASLS
jgi:type III secretion protein Q